MFTSLPTLTEEKFAAYLSANYTGTYLIQQAFTTCDYSLPMIMVKAGKFRETEPGMDVFQGDLSVSVITQIDDDPNAMESHTKTAAEVYEFLRPTTGLYGALNSPTGAFHLFEIYSESYDQEKVDRALVSSLDYKVTAQTLAF